MWRTQFTENIQVRNKKPLTVGTTLLQDLEHNHSIKTNKEHGPL